MGHFRDRIKELRRVRAGDLRPCPWNWRDHPPEQREALEAILAEIGFAGAGLARELDDGSLELIDGHMRAELDLDQEMPVLILDVTEEEAKKILATHDPLGAMSTDNVEARRRLLEEIDAEEASLRKMIADMLAATPADDEEGGRGGKTDLGGPVEMELRPHEHYDYVIVLARNTQEWNRLVELLDLQTIRRRGRIGAARGLPAQKLIELLEGVAKRQQETKPKAESNGNAANRRAKSKART
ncbi:MAG: hypothetical protein WBL72_13170 [Thermoguttaceae bacterium]